MPNFLAYPTVKDTPNRKMRKAKRKTIFETNKVAYRAARKARREARRNANAS